MTFKGQLNRVFELDTTPKRIISLVPSQTELLVDLGLEDSLVGITKFCVRPNHLKSIKTIVGGTKTIKLDIIKSLNPDIILCNKEENTEQIVKDCEQICSVYLSDIYTIEDCLNMIRQYGQLFNVTKEANSIINSITSNLKAFSKFVIDKPIICVAYFVWKNPWMVVGGNTYINHILQLNGYKNIYDHLNRYPEINMETLASKDPELILLSSEPYPFKNKHIELFKKMLPNATIELVDGEAFSWHGSRIAKSFSYFKRLRLKLT